MNELIGVLGTPNFVFLAVVVIGGSAGWIASILAGERHWLFTDVLIGVGGSWLGAQLADLLGIVTRGSAGQFLAAVGGAILAIYVWQRLRTKHGQDNLGPI